MWDPIVRKVIIIQDVIVNKKTMQRKEKQTPKDVPFEANMNKDGSEYKACLVGKGYVQKLGIDINEIFSQVVKLTRFLLATQNLSWSNLM